MISLNLKRNLLAMLSTVFIASMFFSCQSLQNQSIEKNGEAPLYTNSLKPASNFGNVTIRFIKTSWNTKPWSDLSQTYDSRFVIHVIHGVSQKIVLIGGKLFVGKKSRSIFLRSKDGGHSWQEIMKPVEYGYISEILFIGDGIGWAMMKCYYEGSESTHIYTSKDYGESWVLAGSVPDQNVGLGQVREMRFVDVNNGEIWIKSGINSNDRQFCLFRTVDGGVTWQPTKMCCPYEKYSFGRTPNHLSTTFDGTQWQYEYGACCYNNHWIWIQRRTIGQIGWKTIAAIPREYIFKKGAFIEKEIKFTE